MHSEDLDLILEENKIETEMLAEDINIDTLLTELASLKQQITAGEDHLDNFKSNAEEKQVFANLRSD